jgi:hypothetical protein
MAKRSAPVWRLAARMFFVPLFAWLLVAQAILLPLAKAQAASLAGTDSALAILCSHALPLPGDAQDDGAAKKVHDFGCCTLAGRLDLDQPLATLTAPLPLIAPAQLVQRVAYALPQGRAPPAITATPSQARAPPR